MTGVEFLLSIASSIAASSIYERLGNISFFDQRRVNAKLEEIVVNVVEPLSEYLSTEGLQDDDIDRLAELAKEQIEWLLKNTKWIAERGLDSDRITQDLIARMHETNQSGAFSDYPSVFETILRSLVDLAVTLPPTFKEWQQHSFQVTFKLLDEIMSKLNDVYQALAERTDTEENESLFEQIVTSSRNRNTLTLSMDGLSEHSTEKKKVEYLFVFPSFTYDVYTFADNKDEIREEITLETEDEFFGHLSSTSTQLIVAPAGAGKTTLATWLQTALLSPKHRILPLFISLRQYSTHEDLPCLYEILKSNVSSVFLSSLTSEDVKRWAENSKIMAIFDGFDEVAEENRNKICAWIKDLRIAFPGLRCQLTSRPLSTSHLNQFVEDGWLHLSLDPFDNKRIVEYISRFQTHGPAIQTDATPQKPEELANQWQNDPTIGPLTSNPLLLSTLLIVHHLDGELPDDRAELYERYIDGMLVRWETQKGLNTQSLPLTKDQKVRILQLLAINMIEVEKDAVDEKEVEQWLSPYLKSIKSDIEVTTLLAYLRERSGLLIGPGQYSFAHKSIGEFLVAQAVEFGSLTAHNGQRYDRALLKEKCLQDRWTTTVFLWVGLASPPEVKNFIEGLISHPSAIAAPYDHLRLAGGLLSDRQKKLDPEWFSQTIWKFIQMSNEPNSYFFDHSSGDIYIHPSLRGDKQKGIPFHQLKTLGYGDFDFIFLDRLFSTGVLNAQDWKKYYIKSFSPCLWSILAPHIGYEKSFFNKAPIELDEMSRLMIIARDATHRKLELSGLPNDLKQDMDDCLVAHLIEFLGDHLEFMINKKIKIEIEEIISKISKHYEKILSNKPSYITDNLVKLLSPESDQIYAARIKNKINRTRNKIDEKGLLDLFIFCEKIFELFELKTERNLDQEYKNIQKEKRNLAKKKAKDLFDQTDD